MIERAPLPTRSSRPGAPNGELDILSYMTRQGRDLTDIHPRRIEIWKS